MTDKLDEIDRKMVRLLHADANVSQRALATALDLSQNACWRRLQRLKEIGVWRGSKALLDLEKLGYDLTAIVMIKTSSHSREWTESFRKHVSRLPGVTELYRIGGEWDYLIKVTTNGVKGYDRFYQQLVDGCDLTSVTGHFVMEEMLEESLPSEFLDPDAD